MHMPVEANQIERVCGINNGRNTFEGRLQGAKLLDELRVAGQARNRIDGRFENAVLRSVNTLIVILHLKAIPANAICRQLC